uniref:Uncharacterized protein n=1 Tax=Anguilla anguilla TaxID=7936 RepID=A0A0E9TMK2_ANGAN
MTELYEYVGGYLFMFGLVQILYARC